MLSVDKSENHNFETKRERREIKPFNAVLDKKVKKLIGKKDRTAVKTDLNRNEENNG